MSSSGYAGAAAHQRERTQLFSNVRPYSPAQLSQSSTSRSQTPASLFSSGDGPPKPFSDAMLNQLESQNDEQITGLTAKVRVLKDISSKIGAEVNASTNLLSQMEEGFEKARQRVRGTMGRMLIVANEHGIGWRHWLGFFAFVFACFFIVWLV